MTDQNRRMLIIDIEDEVVSPQQVEIQSPLSKGDLHSKAQRELIEAAERWGYPFGLSETFEKSIWLRVDRILKAPTQQSAEELAFEAVYWGSLDFAFWRRKIKK